MVTVPTVFVAPVESRFTPNCVAAERSSSANFTRNRICFSTPGAASWRLLTMVLANGAASAVARSAVSLLETWPVSERESREDWIWISSLGKVSLRSLRSGSKFCSTVML